MFQKTLLKYKKGHESGRQPSGSADIQPDFIPKPFPADLDHPRYIFQSEMYQNAEKQIKRSAAEAKPVN